MKKIIPARVIESCSECDYSRGIWCVELIKSVGDKINMNSEIYPGCRLADAPPDDPRHQSCQSCRHSQNYPAEYFADETGSCKSPWWECTSKSGMVVNQCDMCPNWEAA